MLFKKKKKRSEEEEDNSVIVSLIGKNLPKKRSLKDVKSDAKEVAIHDLSFLEGG